MMARKRNVVILYDKSRSSEKERKMYFRRQAMFRKKILTIVGAVLLFTASQTYAVLQDKIFTSDGVIIEGDDYANVDIYDTPPVQTTVSMSGGSVDRLIAYDSSVLNFTRGAISGLYAHNFSTINVSSGFIHSSMVWDYSTINISGSFNAVEVGASATGIVNVMGGTMEAIAGWGGVINLHGGTVTDNIHAVDGWVNVFGYDLEKSSTGGKYGFGYVGGFWNDGTALTIDLGGSRTYSYINLVPEPATFILFAIGSLLINRKQSFYTVN